MSEHLTVVVVPFNAKHAIRVQNELSSRWGNPAHAPQRRASTTSDASPQPDRRIARALDALGLVHFMGIHAVAGDPGKDYQLVFELALDGTPGETLRRVAETLAEPISQLLKTAGIGACKNVADLLARHEQRLGVGWFGVTGLGFRGTPDYTVARIVAEAKLAQHITGLLEAGSLERRALDSLERTRRQLSNDETWRWAFEPEPILSVDPPGAIGTALLKSLWPSIRDLLWPALVPPAIGYALGSLLGPIPGLGLASAVMVVEAGLGYYIYRKFRKQEQTDAEDQAPASAEKLAQLLELEDHGAQNHLLILTPLKPGLLRRFSLRTALFVAQQATTLVFPPGKLQDISTIHVARWIILPESSQLLFMSNYGGSWGSYLEDFIIKAHTGLTGIWSNSVGFPRASNLFFDGATAGSKFKTWARRYQPPTRCWYSAYPELTTARIRTNAAIRSGLAQVRTEAEAERWLALFGARTPEAIKPIDPEQAPALVYGGMGKLRFGKSVLLRFADGAQAQRFLADVEAQVGFGEHASRNTCVSVGFTASGLQAFGLNQQALESFPIAFQHGSARRARILGDTGPDAPDHWSWGGATHSAVHAIVLLYADTEAGLAALDEKLGARSYEFRYDVAFQSDLNEREAFGFVDGVSQPIVGGTRRALKAKRQHQLLAPGEFVLGYADESRRVPSGPSVSAAADATSILPELDANQGTRDLGRNGTYLVVRQLEQNTAGFEAFLEKSAQLLSERATGISPAHLKEWVGAKMFGRWRNGTSLVRFPQQPGPDQATDNDFMYVEDRDGLNCPLGAHIRRANPRDSLDPKAKRPLEVVNRHRIVRVGRNYTEGSARGLMFMCLNSDIERQFEFIQQTWLHEPSFHGLRNEADPVMTPRRAASDPKNAANGEEPTILTIPTETGPLALRGHSDFVRVRGSGYFFMPSRQCLHFLARAATDARAERCVTQSRAAE